MDDTKKKTILLVEDEPDARQIYTDILLSGGYNVVACVDGQDAENKLEQFKGQVNLVLLDIITPNKDGIQTLAEIKANPDKFGTPMVIMLSNIAGDLSVEKAIELGADGYMLKAEVNPEDLLTAISKYFGND